MIKNNVIFDRIIIVGDSYGIKVLLKYIDPSLICGFLAAYTRPQYLKELKKIASSYNLPLIIQPKYKSTKYSLFVKKIIDIKPNLIFCYSYSMIIREDILDLVNYHAFNVHESFLPYNRGPNSENWAVISGETFTGCSIHLMDNGIDTGDIVKQVKVDIDFTDTWVEVLKKTNKVAEALIKNEWMNIVQNLFNRKRQNNKRTTTNFRLNANYPKIDFLKMCDLEIYNLIRGQVTPLKGAFVEHDNVREYFPNFIPYNQIKALRKRVTTQEKKIKKCG